MTDKIESVLDNLIERYPCLEECRKDIFDVFLLIKNSYEKDGKLLIAGNGGSAADSEHIVGELMKSFRKSRPISEELARKLYEVDSQRGPILAQNLECTLTAIPLVANEALSTAYINDVGGTGIFAQQLLGYGREGDVFLGISTSGNSENILNAAIVAHAMNIKVVGLTGKDGGILAPMTDACICVPQTETYLIQELHLPVYHALCLMLENQFFG